MYHTFLRTSIFIFDSRFLYLKITLTKINVVRKVVSVGLSYSTLMTGCCNFGCETDFTVFTEDPADKNILTRENIVRKLKKDYTSCNFRKKWYDATTFEVHDRYTKICEKAFTNYTLLRKL